MRLIKARITKYRSIKDSGWFDVDLMKTILVGPNEGGKTVLLQALQRINPPADVAPFDPLRDYPRSEYNDITTGRINPSTTTVASAQFALEDDDTSLLPEDFQQCTYITGRRLDNTFWHRLNDAPPIPTYDDIRRPLLRLAEHLTHRAPEAPDKSTSDVKPSEKLKQLTAQWSGETQIAGDAATALSLWLDEYTHLIDENDAKTDTLAAQLRSSCEISARRLAVLQQLRDRLPIFVLFNNYFRVRPLIHLDHLATRIEQKLLDDNQYDYGNQCLLKLLGFTARELSNLGKAPEPASSDPAALKTYRDQLDRRAYQLNAASVRLTNDIKAVWNPDPRRAEADRVRITADQQYLKAVVEDDLGVEIELDQRSEGFQWLVSFFVVFFAEAAEKHENAILLLDEPGLSLHGLKQRDFRETIARLAVKNQTLYTTHSPFLVGPDELDLVRVVEMKDRAVGTKVHTTVTADDPAALLPLQEALGYDLAQSLFAQQRNLVLEGLTDFWYVESTSELLRGAGIAHLNPKIALIPANKASKVVYFATILHAHRLRVAALLDSDAAGEQAARQDVLVHALGNKRVIRTKDAYKGDAGQLEIEDMLRETLVSVAAKEFGVDVSSTAKQQATRPVVNIFEGNIPEFSKYRMAKAYVRWTREHQAGDLTILEREQWTKLVEIINNALK